LLRYFNITGKIRPSGGGGMVTDNRSWKQNTKYQVFSGKVQIVRGQKSTDVRIKGYRILHVRRHCRLLEGARLWPMDNLHFINQP